MRTPLARRRSLRPSAAAVLCLAALAGCGDDGGGAGDERSAAGAPPQLPFPPRAEEPLTSDGGGDQPAGRVLRIGGRPEGIAIDPDSRTVAVALDDDQNRVALIDADSMQVRSSVPMPGSSRHLERGAGSSFLVPLESADRLAVLPADGGDPRITEVGDGPHDAAAADGQIFVGDEFGGTLTVLRDGERRAQLPIDVQPGGVADVGGGKVALVSVRAYTIELIDTETLELSGSQSAGYGPSHVVADTGDGRAYIADTRGGAILHYETRPRLKAIARLQTGSSPYGIAIDPGRDRLWVTRSGADELLEIDISGEEPRIVRRLATVRQPNTVGVDEQSGAVFVVGKANGELQRIEP